MQDHEHGPRVGGSHIREFLFAEIRGPRRQGLVGVRRGLRDKVDGEGPLELDVVGLEDAPLVVHVRAVLGGRGPYRLQMSVEEQRVELAGRDRVATHLEKSCWVSFLVFQRH